MARKKMSRKAKGKAGRTKKQKDTVQDILQGSTGEAERSADPVAADAALEPTPVERPVAAHP